MGLTYFVIIYAHITFFDKINENLKNVILNLFLFLMQVNLQVNVLNLVVS